MIDADIGLSTGCFYRTPILDTLGPIRDAGFRSIEVCSAKAHLDYHDTAAVRRAADRLHALGLEPYSFHAPFADAIDITSADRRQREESEREMERAIAAAAALGAGHLVLHPGPERPAAGDCDRLEGMERAVEILDRIDRSCRGKGIRLVLENMLPHLFSGHVRDLMWILGAMHETDVGVCLDTGHAYLSGEIDGVVEKLSAHLWMVHANDNHGRYDDHLPPGDGAIDWDVLLAKLCVGGFCGKFVLEIGEADGAADGARDETLRLARRGREHLAARLGTSRASTAESTRPG